MPYALAQCGWLGLPVLALVTGIFCLSGKLIIRAFASLPSGVPHAYPELGELHGPTCSLKDCLLPNLLS